MIAWQQQASCFRCGGRPRVVSPASGGLLSVPDSASRLAAVRREGRRKGNLNPRAAALPDLGEYLPVIQEAAKNALKQAKDVAGLSPEPQTGVSSLAALSLENHFPGAHTALEQGCRTLCSNLSDLGQAIQGWDGMQLFSSGVLWSVWGDQHSLVSALALFATLWGPVLLPAFGVIVVMRWILRGFAKSRWEEMHQNWNQGRPISLQGPGSGLSTEPTNILTILMIASTVLCFYVQVAGALPGQGKAPNFMAFFSMTPDLRREGLVSAWAQIPAKLLRGEYWRLWTPALLHANLMHLFVNLQAWWSFRRVETWFGGLGYVFIYAMSAIGASLTSFTFSASGNFSVGASGAICGLMGADMVVSRPGECLQVLAGLGLLTVIVSLLPFQIVDNWAHWGGLVTGYLAGSLLGILHLLLRGITRRRDTPSGY